MAYIDRTTGRSQRATVLVSVALLQGAAIVALVHGLTIRLIDKPPETATAGYQVPIEPRPEPEQPKRADPPRTEITRTTTTIPAQNDSYNPSEEFKLLPPVGNGPIGDDFGLTPPPQPDPAPGFAPRMPKPLGKPSQWVTASDYPSRDIRLGNQGATGFTLSIGTRGQVLSCAITSTSGSASLDAAACGSLERRARFEPAIDSAGNKVIGEYRSKIRWELPE